MELTKKDLEQILDQKLNMLVTAEVLDQRLSKLATKEDLKNAVFASEKKIIARIGEAQEELAIMTEHGFADVLAHPDFKEKIQKLEKGMSSIKMALSLT
jgi:hypothetical protein